MKNKGFTLVELLAVIVVIAIIALIIIPNVTLTVSKSEKDSFRNSAYGILDAAKQYYQEQVGEKKFTGKTFDFSKKVELELEGKKPTGGTVTINSDGDIEIKVTDNKYCAIKEFDNEDITIYSMSEVVDCGGDMEKPSVLNLVANDIKAKGFMIIGACDATSGISKYEFSLYKGETLVKKVESKDGVYVFDNLDEETDYKVNMQCQSKNGITSKSDDLEVSTKKELVSCSVSPNTNKYESKRKVTIKYNAGSDYTREYEINGEVKETTEDVKEIEFSDKGEVVARVRNGLLTEQVLCSVNKVDNTLPSSEVRVIDTDEIDGNITVGAYCSDAESQIVKYEYAITDKEEEYSEIERKYESDNNVFRFINLDKEKKYYVYVKCTNGADLETVSEKVEASTKNTILKCEIDKSGYANEGKTVTISYPENYQNKYAVSLPNIAYVDNNLITTTDFIDTEKRQEKILVTNTSDTYGKIVSLNGNSMMTVCSVNNIDTSKPTVTLSSEPPVGEWYYKDKNIVINKHDEGSGLYAYYVSTKDTPPKSSSSCLETDQNDEWVCDSNEEIKIPRGLSEVSKNGPTTYYVWVMDNAGNVSETSSILIDYIENTKPTCSLKIIDGTMGDNNWYVSDVKVEMTVKDQKGSTDYYDASGVESYGFGRITNNNEEEEKNYNATSLIYTLNVDGKNKIKGYVKDKAGNENECEIDIKRDTEKPSCSFIHYEYNRSSGEMTGSFTNNTWTFNKVKTEVTAVDVSSKVKSVEFIPSGAIGTSKVKHDDENLNTVKEEYVSNSEGESTLNVEIIDYAGNKKNCDAQYIKQDFTTSITCGGDVTIPSGAYTTINNVTNYAYYMNDGIVSCTPSVSSTGSQNITCSSKSNVSGITKTCSYTVNHQYAARVEHHSQTCTRTVQESYWDENCICDTHCVIFVDSCWWEITTDDANQGSKRYWKCMGQHCQSDETVCTGCSKTRSKTESYDCSYDTYHCDNGGSLHDDHICYT